MLIKDLPKVTAADLALSDGLVGDTADKGTGLIPLDEAMKFLDSKRGYHVNPNLLINADFCNPVNRNGKSEYISAGYTIDKWKIATKLSLTIMDNFLRLKKNTLSANPYFSYSIENIASWLDHKITLSFLYRNYFSTGVRAVINAQNSSVQEYKQLPYSDTWQLVSYTFQVAADTKSISELFWFQFTSAITSTEEYFDLAAVKLEKGSISTLAHKVDDEAVGYDGWVLNDPPNYDLQHALCSQYSPITGEFIGSQHSNPNLLDNVYWADKAAIVNQRNKDDYSDIKANQYWIDRFEAYPNSTVGTVKLLITDNGIELQNVNIWQKVPNLKDGIYTASYLTADNELQTITGVVNNNTHDSVGASISLIGIYYTTANGWYVHMNFVNTQPNVLKRIIAVKLELGPVQTLAHKEGDTWVLNDQPPNYGQELAKCQRYQLFGSLLATSYMTNYNNLQYLWLPTPTTLKSKPVIVGDYIVVRASNNTIIEGAQAQVHTRHDNGVIITVTNTNGEEAYLIPKNANAIWGLDAN